MNSKSMEMFGKPVTEAPSGRIVSAHIKGAGVRDVSSADVVGEFHMDYPKS
jgi:hypothetical protein